MGDRVGPGESLTLDIPFLGGHIAIPGAPFYLAASVGAPIAVVFTRRSGPSQVAGRVWKVIRPKANSPARKHSTLMPMARAFVSCLEEYVHAEPFQFFNFYNLWSIGEEHGNKE
jgi:predicted LPLAT superfamily acyltransferase